MRSDRASGAEERGHDSQVGAGSLHLQWGVHPAAYSSSIQERMWAKTTMTSLLPRFAQTLAECGVPGVGSVGVALSGGTDSLALASLTAFWARGGECMYDLIRPCFGSV